LGVLLDLSGGIGGEDHDLARSARDQTQLLGGFLSAARHDDPTAGEIHEYGEVAQ